MVSGGRSADDAGMEGRKPLVHDDRIQVGAGRPRDGAGFGIDSHTGEQLGVPEGLEHRSIELACEV
jgi:hypothetical protein